MILTSLLSFFGGSAFRTIWGEISAYLSKRQDHQFELERIAAEGAQAAAEHARHMEAIKVQAELGVKSITAQSEADIEKLAAEGWAGAVQTAAKPIGVAVVDIWNGVVRPFLATVAILLWIAALVSQSFVMTDWDKELCGAVLGFFLADRALTRRGK